MPMRYYEATKVGELCAISEVSSGVGFQNNLRYLDKVISHFLDHFQSPKL